MISLVYYFWCIKHLTSSHDGCLFHWTNYPCIAVKLSKITQWSSWMPHAQSLAHLVSLAIFFQGKSGLLKADIFKFTTLLRRSKKNAAKREFFFGGILPRWNDCASEKHYTLQDNRSMILEELGLGQTANIVLFYWGGEVCLYSKESQLKPAPWVHDETLLSGLNSNSSSGSVMLSPEHQKVLQQNCNALQGWWQ